MKTAIIVLFVFLQSPSLALAERTLAEAYCVTRSVAYHRPSNFMGKYEEMCNLAMEVDKLKLLDAKKTLKNKLDMGDNEIFPQR